VERDLSVSNLGEKIGSGYPSDAVTLAWLNGYFKRHNSFPNFVRHSWETIKRVLNPTVQIVQTVPVIQKEHNPEMEKLTNLFRTVGISSKDATKYASNFIANDINSTLLSELNYEILKELGVISIGHRLRILTVAKRNQ